MLEAIDVVVVTETAIDDTTAVAVVGIVVDAAEVVVATVANALLGDFSSVD